MCMLNEQKPATTSLHFREVLAVLRRHPRRPRGRLLLLAPLLQRARLPAAAAAARRAACCRPRP